MKKSFLTLVSVAVIMLTNSCAKECACTRYEDGKKISITANDDVKYFEKAICKDNSVAPYQGYSSVVKDKEVTVEIKCK